MGSPFCMSLPGLANTDDGAVSLEHAMSAIASAISDPSRVRILCALMDGRAWTATELSAVADIATSTASGHLARLLQSGLTVCLSQGRHRYYRLAGSDVACLLENIMGMSVKHIRTPETRAPLPLRRARTCYDHLAGEIAVELYACMKANHWITADGSTITQAGLHHFQSIGAVLNPKTKRKPCCDCLDWSERRFHLGGDAGAALFLAFEAQGWLVRIEGYREVRFTEAGKKALQRHYGVVFTD